MKQIICCWRCQPSVMLLVVPKVNYKKGDTITVFAAGCLVAPKDYEWVGWGAPNEPLPVRFFRGPKVKANQTLVIRSSGSGAYETWSRSWTRNWKQGHIFWALSSTMYGTSSPEHTEIKNKILKKIKEEKAVRRKEAEKNRESQEKKRRTAKEYEDNLLRQIEELKEKKAKEAKDKYEKIVSSRRSRSSWYF